MKIRTKGQLLEHLNQGNKVKYVFFWGHRQPAAGVSKSCFSQWYVSPFVVDDKKFITAEHYMMYQKAKLFKDEGAMQRLLSAGSPGEAKAIGRQVTGFDEDVWGAARFEIVVKANFAKFGYHKDLREFLLNTRERILMEASPVDKIWGIGLAEDDPASQKPNLWKGSNLLGFALMEVRDQLFE